jgi:hypothetical protein
MFHIETDGVLNGHLVFPEHVRMNIIYEEFTR